MSYWNLEPDDPPEPRDVKVCVCPECKCLADDCEVEAHEGDYKEDDGLECPDCGQEFYDEDDWLKHECEGYQPDEDDYL